MAAISAQEASAAIALSRAAAAGGAPAIDRSVAAVAAGYVQDLRAVVKRIRAQQSSPSVAAVRLRTAAHHAIAGILTYSEIRQDLDLAIAELEDLELARHRRRLCKDATELRGYGAVIPPQAVDALVEHRARVTVRARLDELHHRRIAAGMTTPLRA